MIARWKSGSRFSSESVDPLRVLKAFSASSDGVVASSSGSRVFLDGGERFSNSRPETGRNLTECAQDLFFACRLRLLFGEDVAGRAVLRAQAEDVLTAELAIDPSRTAALAVRTHTSCAMSGVNRASGGWFINDSVLRMRSSEMRLRNGDCWS